MEAKNWTEKKSLMEIPRDKPDGIWDSEWAAMHLECMWPGLHDAGYLAEIKAVTMDVTGDRIGVSQGRARLHKYLRQRGYSADLGFPDNPDGWQFPCDPDSEGDLRSFKTMDTLLGLQIDIAQGAAKKWLKRSHVDDEIYPAWMLVKYTTEISEEWKDRWMIAGGRIFAPLIQAMNPNTQETGMIALKDDPIWAAPGDRNIFPDALGIDHPPFYINSGLSWDPVLKIEAIAHGLLPSGMPQKLMEESIRRHIDYKKNMQVLSKRAVQRRSEEYARRNSPEALHEKYKDQAQWYDTYNFSIKACEAVKKATASGEDLKAIMARIRTGLLRKELSHKPKVEAALRRALGLAHESSGLVLDACVEYKRALTLDPKVGCKRDYERLTSIHHRGV